MNIGVSSGCFYPEKTDKCLELVASTGAKFAEIFFNTDSELDESYVRNLKRIADENNIKIISIHPYTSAIETFMFFSPNDYKLADSIKYYEKYFKACQILGAKYVVIHGCLTAAKHMTMERYAHNMNLLSRKAREYGVYLSQENVVRFKCGYVENLREFIRYADEDIKFVFDLKQSVRAEQNAKEIVDLMGSRISHLHLSDFTDEADSLLPGKGGFDYNAFFEYVVSNYGVENALIEVYNNNIDGIESVTNSLNLLQFIAMKNENVYNKK